MIWFLYVLLSIIWGSSFILMKEGLISLSAYEVAAVRMLSAGLISLPFAIQSYMRITPKQRLYSVTTGLLGSFIPAILFCVAETKIDSALAGMLNALTPLFVLVIGFSFFGLALVKEKLVGVLIGFTGMIVLFINQTISLSFDQLPYLALIVTATICYGINVNIASRHLKGVEPLAIASVAFTFLIPLSMLILWQQDFFSHSFNERTLWKSLGASAILGVTGTAIATILFYMLMKKAGPLFSSMVTYGIPFVAIAWGYVYGEKTTLIQLAGLLIILAGVYVVNRFDAKKVVKDQQ
jgi:drug/metabolite transporter (DMT)-like permease